MFGSGYDAGLMCLCCETGKAIIMGVTRIFGYLIDDGFDLLSAFFSHTKAVLALM